MLLLGEASLHVPVARVDAPRCHISHPCLLVRTTQLQILKSLKINMAVSWYLNAPGVHHLDLVICYVNTRKVYATVDKEIQEIWTILRILQSKPNNHATENKHLHQNPIYSSIFNNQNPIQ